MPQQSMQFSCAFPKCSALPTVALAKCVHASTGCDAFHAECFLRYCAENKVSGSSAPLCYPCAIVWDLQQLDAEEDEALFVDDHVDGGGATTMCKEAGGANCKADDNVHKLGAPGAADADSDNKLGSLEAAALTPELTQTALTTQPIRADDTAETVASPEAHAAGRATESYLDAATDEADEAPAQAVAPAQAAELSADSGPAVQGKPRGPPPPQGSLVGSRAACIACGEATLPVVSGSTAHDCEGCGWPVHVAIMCARVCACRLRHECMRKHRSCVLVLLLTHL